jgi:hypothetical protein
MVEIIMCANIELELDSAARVRLG